jgi:hypothetical protein
MTSDAAIPVENGGRYSNTRLLSRSAAHRFPDLSNVTPTTVLSPVADGALAPVELKLGWPITSVGAEVKLANGG